MRRRLLVVEHQAVISVVVRLHSAIDPSRDRLLAAAIIANDGTLEPTGDRGNYDYRIAHTRSEAAIADFLESGGERQVWKRGNVQGYNRSRTVWVLLGMVLKAARFRP